MPAGGAKSQTKFKILIVDGRVTIAFTIGFTEDISGGVSMAKERNGVQKQTN